MSTEPDPILAAIAAMRENPEIVSRTAQQRKYSIVTKRRCDGGIKTNSAPMQKRTNAEAHQDAMLLNPQQELELVHYI
jgi:hypothetical protein